MEAKSKGNLKKVIVICIVILIFITFINLFNLWNDNSRWPLTKGKWNIQGFDKGDYLGPISIELDSNENPHITYTSSFFDGDDLKYTYWVDNSRNSSTIDSGDPEEDIHSSMALDSNDNPHISYNNNGLIYAIWNGSGWENETVDNKGGRFNSIALDSNDNPHISYQGNGGLNYSRFDGKSWIIENIDNSGEFTSLDLDSNNYPHIAYEYGSEIKYASWNGNSWTLNTVAKNAWTPSIVLDSRNRPHISYAKELEIYVTRWNGNSWQKELVDSREPGHNHYDGLTSIALDENNDEYLSYICDSTLRFAKKYNGAWITEVLSPIGHASSSSINVDSQGSVHIGCNQDQQVRYIVNVEYDSDGDGVSDSEDFLPEFNNYVFNAGMPALIIIILAIIFIIISRKKTKKTDEKESEDEDSKESVDK